MKARRRRRGDDLRAEDQPEGTNLAAVDLTDAELTNANLSSVDLYTSYLNSATLTAANLSNAKLNHAELKAADLRRANLWKADLRGAYLWRAVGITNECLEQQASSLKGATMSDSHKYEDWLKDRGGRKEDGENE